MSTEADSLPPPEASSLGESLVGSKVDKYEIVRVIGRGGMGTVYEAVHTTIGKRVAMKLIDPELARNTDAVARFQREAQAASAVESAHIVEIFDSGTTPDGVPYLVMELLRGEDLGHRLKRCGRLELAEALHVVAHILRGLHRAHAAGIVHRDLKPDNVFLVDRDDDASFAKILDFGISKFARRADVPLRTLTRQGTVLGTPFYMSPEQAQAQPDVDGRSDIWSVGAILFECLTGRPPHTGTTYEQVIVAICMNDADDVRAHNPAVPEPIARVVAKALARDRDERFASAREMLDALASAAGDAVSARSFRGSGDETLTPRPIGGVSSAPGAVLPVSPSETSAARGATGTPSPGCDALDDTLTAGPDAPSRVGWSTSGGRLAAAARKKRIYAIGATALLTGGALAFAWGGGREPEAEPGAAGARDEVAVRLETNAPGARFLVEGEPLPSGVLRGPRGERRRVRIEAEGYAPLETSVVLDPATETVQLELAELPKQPAPSAVPLVEPAGEGPAAAGAAGAPEGDGPDRGSAKSAGAAAGAKGAGAAKKGSGAPAGGADANGAKATSAKTTAGAAAHPAKPAGKGVAGQLRIKTE